MNRRRKYFIEKEFQGKFIVKFCTIVVLSSITVGVLLFIFSMGSTTVAIENTKIVVKNTADFILPMIVITLILVTTFSAITVAAVSLFMTHKIVGPVYRLKIDASKLADGDLTVDFRVRSGDQLKELAWSLTEAAANLKEKIHYLKGTLGRMERVSLSNDEIKKVKQTLDFFKTL